MQAVGKIIGDRYRLEREAGAGGMGTVFLARDLQTDQPVAVKLLHPSADAVGDKRFIREAEVLASLRAPEIVRYLAHGRMEDESPYLVIEWLEGETLERRLAQAPLGYLDVAKVGTQVATALELAHRHGVIHRDIKPANVFLVGGSTDRVKTLDFGLARLPGERAQLTEAGVFVGTPLWLSPEQARGEPLDGRSDLFSLGSLLYTCISGASPFARKDLAEVLLATGRGEMTPVEQKAAGVPPRLAELLGLLLRADREQRPADAGWVAAELAALRDALALEQAAIATGPTLAQPRSQPSLANAPTLAAPLPAPPAAAPVVVSPLVVGSPPSPPPGRAGVSPWMVLLIGFPVVAVVTIAVVVFFLHGAPRSQTGREETNASAPRMGSAAPESLSNDPVDLDLDLGDLSNVEVIHAFGVMEKDLLRHFPGVEVLQYTASGLPGGKLDLNDPATMLTVVNTQGKSEVVRGHQKLFEDFAFSPGQHWPAGPFVLPHCTLRQIYDDAVLHGFPRERPFYLAISRVEGGSLLHLSATGSHEVVSLVPGTCKTKKE